VIKIAARSWLMVVIFGLVGLAAGLIAAHLYSGTQERVKAQATLSMLPGPEVPASTLPDYWDVLNQGQPTRSAAIVLADTHWLNSAARAAGVPRSELELAAGAIPETSLITVTMKADSPEAAERALDSVLKQASSLAASASGPYILETVTPPIGSARSIMPTQAQWVTGLGIGGFLVGAGLGLLISRWAQQRSSVSDRLAMPEEDGPADSGGSEDEKSIPPPAFDRPPMETRRQ
jgi:hypothetical protein